MASTRKRMQTSVYQDNYGYGINYYQPMIDYITAKDKGKLVPYPHLPMSDERGLEAYSPRKLVRNYTQEDLRDLAEKTEKSAKLHESQFRATQRTGFAFRKAVFATNITKKVEIESEAAARKTFKKSKKLTKEILHAKSKMDDVDYNFNAEEKVKDALKSAQNYLRGKSAKAIEAQLLHESQKNISEGTNLDIKAFQRNRVINVYDSRDHDKFMCQRMEAQLSDSFVLPLDQLNADLKSFDKKTST